MIGLKIFFFIAACCIVPGFLVTIALRVNDWWSNRDYVKNVYGS